jgi:hypothetical protein
VSARYSVEKASTTLFMFPSPYGEGEHASCLERGWSIHGSPGYGSSVYPGQSGARRKSIAGLRWLHGHLQETTALAIEVATGTARDGCRRGFAQLDFFRTRRLVALATIATASIFIAAATPFRGWRTLG